MIMKENTIDKQYQALLQDILDNGYVKKDRTGTGTKSVFGRTIRHKMSDGFPLLTSKKMYFKGVVTELLWFLRGDTNIQYLLENDCHIWDGDAYKRFVKTVEKNRPEGYDREVLTKEEFIKEFKTNPEFGMVWGDLGPIYGKQWRNWEVIDHSEMKIHTYKIDQIADAIKLLKTDPDSRRNIVNAWNVGEIDQMVLPPCHMFFQFYTRELTTQERKDLYDKTSYAKDTFPTDENGWNNLFDGFNIPKRAVSLMWYQRSVDTPLGLPFNIASYALLLEIVGKMVNMVPDELIGTLGDTHIYLNQVDGVKEQIGKKLSIAERRELLIQAMGEEDYKDAVSGLMPFGGGMSEYFEMHKIPTHTREPFPLPTLKTGKTDAFYKSLSEDLTLFGHLDPSDFTVENYKSHSTIKYPLSN